MPTPIFSPNRVSTDKPKIDQITLDQLIATHVGQGPSTSLSNLLDMSGYSTTISDVNIKIEHETMLDFSDCQFSRVKLIGEFNNKSFENVQFNDTHFEKTNFTGSTFNHVSFSHCHFNEANFKSSSHLYTTLKEGVAWGANFTDSSFYQSNINNSIFVKTQFENILNHENKTQGIHLVFNQDVPPNYAFEDAIFHEVTPKVSIVEDATWFSTPQYLVSKYSGIPMSASPYAETAETNLLKTEIKKAISNIDLTGLNGLSIPQYILNSDQPTINKIKAKAYEIMEKSDSLWIPGSGDDIHPEFYGQTPQHVWYSDEYYYREILEFSLTEAAISLNKPVIGICHGSQMVNVYLGGTLHQHVNGHSGITPELEVLTQEGPLGSVIKGPIKGPSYHHQAVDKIADSLEVVAMYDGVIKATQSNEGKPIILCQFHPEYEVDQNSKNILQQFMNLSVDSAMNNKVLQLSDILHHDNHLFMDSSNDFMIPSTTASTLVTPSTHEAVPHIETVHQETWA